jgi:predicted NBD/HSP70 family sugar kinase
LGAGLARLVQAFNPSLVVLGGRLGGLMQPFESVIAAEVARTALPSMTEKLDLQVNFGQSNCLRGGLATVFDAVMTDPPLEREPSLI